MVEKRAGDLELQIFLQCLLVWPREGHKLHQGPLQELAQSCCSCSLQGLMEASSRASKVRFTSSLEVVFVRGQDWRVFLDKEEAPPLGETFSKNRP